MIDDISVIVLEFGSLEPEPAKLPPFIDRTTMETNSITSIKHEILATPGVVRGDPIRGSFIHAKDPNAKKPRFDPKRGSHVANNDDEYKDENEDFQGIPSVLGFEGK